LARLLQAIILSLLLAASLYAAPFSHRDHLRLKDKLTCVTCHSSAASSTKTEDNLLPSGEICLMCHRARINPPPATKVAKFNHQQHLKLGNIAPVLARAIDSGQYLSEPGDMRRWLDTKNPCEACHRGLEESEKISPANLPRMADCLVCHNKIDPPYSCETCHTDVPALIPATHTGTWVDVHSDPKIGKQSCAVCHGRRFRCQGCH
jgi:hypothetical protein